MTETEEVVPWTEENKDYGRDLGTGAVGPDGEEPKHKQRASGHHTVSHHAQAQHQSEISNPSGEGSDAEGGNT